MGTNASRDDATEALLDKMAKDSFPASDPPQLAGSIAADEPANDLHRRAGPSSGVIAEIELGEDAPGAGRDDTLVLEGRDAAILHVVAEGRRLQIALPSNPLEVGAADLDALVAVLVRARGRLRPELPV